MRAAAVAQEEEEEEVAQEEASERERRTKNGRDVHLNLTSAAAGAPPTPRHGIESMTGGLCRVSPCVPSTPPSSSSSWATFSAPVVDGVAISPTDAVVFGGSVG